MWLLLLASAGAAVTVTWLPDEAEDGAVQPVDCADRAARTAHLAQPAKPQPPPASASAFLAPSPPAALAEAPAATSRTAWPALSPSARQAWTPPPPPPPPPPPAPPPAVVPPPAPPPAFPYEWLGQIEEEGQVRFFLAGPQRTLAVRAGEVLDQRWRINGAEAGRLLLTWLPTDTAVSVAAR